jgi:hypothetical protein
VGSFDSGVLSELRAGGVDGDVTTKGCGYWRNFWIISVVNLRMIVLAGELALFSQLQVLAELLAARENTG